MELRQYMDETIQPLVQADGGWLEYTSEKEGELVLTAKGECARCICAERCLRWVEERIFTDTGRRVQIHLLRDPFLWRK